MNIYIKNRLISRLSLLSILVAINYIQIINFYPNIQSGVMSGALISLILLITYWVSFVKSLKEVVSLEVDLEEQQLIIGKRYCMLYHFKSKIALTDVCFSNLENSKLLVTDSNKNELCRLSMTDNLGCIFDKLDREDLKVFDKDVLLYYQNYWDKNIRISDYW